MSDSPDPASVPVVHDLASGLTRHALVRTLPVVALAFPLALLLEDRSGGIYPFDAVTYPAMGVLFVLLEAWLLRRPGAKNAVVLITLLTTAVFFLGKLAYVVHFTPTASEIPVSVSASFLWLSALFALGYLLPGGRIARWFNPVMLTALPLTALVAALTRPDPLHPGMLGGLVQLILSSLAIHVLARASHLRTQQYARTAALAEATERLAHTDALTRLPNRRAFDRRMTELVEAGERQGREFCLVYLDLDGFKAINDTHGHATGDFALQVMAERLRRVCTPPQDVARLSGDEFVIILPDADTEQARAVATRVMREVRVPIDLGGDRVPLTVSAGISHYPRHGRDAHTLLRAADLAMYEVKHAHRDGVQVAAAPAR